ncbi:type II toxin-antitoxin system VapC family toxin [Halanaeroarchaeum sulfurireducens]|uniref:PilT protein domain protein n=1 Tax=Halanaeroarchaeum sulfurireducens TaxID=1604004 RepID=A0A0N9MFN1_9EURY|nr:PIN domain-containing protein [Halanaeroarchaeum sulfurireducens]ALG80929.1 PilT protein domain protein [Halanaeroarchaeum sulfurireducens]
MPRALLDTTVLFAAAYQRDGLHDEALPILQGIDQGDLPEGIVLDFVPAETMNGVTTHAGHEAAVDFLDHLEENSRFHIASLTGDAMATAKSLFRQYERFSFVDACIVAHMQGKGFGHLYAFDDDFDALTDVYRLNTATNPYRPE